MKRSEATAKAVKAAEAAESLVTHANAPQPPRPSERGSELKMPLLRPGFDHIVERVYDLQDPEGEFVRLKEGLELREALTPQVVQQAKNCAESNALQAHRVFVCAKADYERFEAESDQIMGAMRDAASEELQVEKNSGKRSKAITNADVDGRAAQLFPDEWSSIQTRRVKASGMLAHLERLAELWSKRCYSLAGMEVK